MSIMSMSETDAGTKGKARKAVKRILDGRGRIFHRKMLEYMEGVIRDAKKFCPVGETGMLQASIHAQKTESMEGGYFQAGRDLFEGWNITAGGPPYYNWIHKRFVDYASTVHNGHVTSAGTYTPPQPFLDDAIAINRPYFDRLTKEYMDWMEKEWSKD